MKAIHFFYAGLVIDALLLLLCLSNLTMLSGAAAGGDAGQAPGLTAFGRLAVWVLPVLLLLLIGGAYLLKNAGKMLAANILLWIPALPMAAGILLWGGLALLFLIAGK